MSKEHIVMRLRELVSVNFQWAPMPLDDQSYKVDFPSREDLARLLQFGMSKVPNSSCVLEFEAWSNKEPEGVPLAQLWVRCLGAPSAALDDFLVTCSLGSLVGKTEKVDMPFTRAHGVARLLISVVGIEHIPDVDRWSYAEKSYDLEILIEENAHFQELGEHMDMDSEDRHRVDGSQDNKKDLPDDHEKEPKRSQKSPSVLHGKQPSASTPAPVDGLNFGSFGSLSAPSRLQGGNGLLQLKEQVLPSSTRAVPPVQRPDVLLVAPGSPSDSVVSLSILATPSMSRVPWAARTLVVLGSTPAVADA